MVTESIEALSQRAREAMEQRNWEKARQYYLQALGLKSDSPEVHQGLATVCFQLRDLPSAAYHFKEVTRLDPLRAGAYINLGAVYNLLGQLDDAIPVLRRGIQLDAHRPEGHYNLALVYRRKGQNDHAIQAYRDALRANPRMTDAHLNIANLYAEKEQYRLAIAHYKRTLELRPNWEKAKNGLAEAEAALAAQDQPAQLAPMNAPPKAPEPAPAGPGAADRHVDPNVHGVLLSTLHKAALESESHNRHFLKVIEAEIEPAIKDLSSYLLHPGSSASDLDHCVQKFENAVQSMRSAQRNLQSSIERLRTIGDKLFQS